MQCMLQFRNIMDADIAWMPLTAVLARFKTDGYAVDSENSSQADTTTLASHCGSGGSGSFTPPSSDEQAGSSLIPTPRGNDSLTLTAPSSPDNRMKNVISDVDAYNVTIGRVPDKLTYRNEGRPNSQHHKNMQKNYVCWLLWPDPAQPDNRAADWAWVRFCREPCCQCQVDAACTLARCTSLQKSQSISTNRPCNAFV